MDTKLFVATKALIVREGKVLVVRESSQYTDGTQVGLYDTPGGRMQPGQKLDESLLREVMEETGLNIEIGSPFFVNESWPVVRGEQWQVVRIFFECRSLVGEVRLSDDHDDYKWIDPNDYASADLIGNLNEVFEAYLRNKTIVANG